MPLLPYRVESVTAGYRETARQYPVKIYLDGRQGSPGDYLTPDEVAVWEYVQWSEAERGRLAAQVIELQLMVADLQEQIAGHAGKGGKAKKVEPVTPLLG